MALAALVAASEAGSGAEPAVPGPDVVWVQSAAELESLARAALPLRLPVGGAWTGQEIVVEGARDLRTEPGRLRFHLSGHLNPLGVPLEADPALTLRFDPVKGVHIVGLEALTLVLGPLGKVDLSRLIGPWEIPPQQKVVVPVRGGAGLGMEVTIKKLALSPQGLRGEVSVRYFPPPRPAGSSTAAR
jgi:hypothetical protein